MNINATLLVQMINFGITYTMLRLLLFKPAVAIIEAEEAHIAKILDDIDHKKNMVEAITEERREHWRLSQEYVEANSPVLIEPYCTVQQDRDTPIKSSDQDIDSLVMAVYTSIEDRIKHVH
jgi:hypothetical protein